MRLQSAASSSDLRAAGGSGGYASHTGPEFPTGLTGCVIWAYVVSLSEALCILCLQHLWAGFPASTQSPALNTLAALVFATD